LNVTEYCKQNEISRNRARFVQGAKTILLYTGRPYEIQYKGVRHLIFLGPPEEREFYTDLLPKFSNGADLTEESKYIDEERSLVVFLLCSPNMTSLHGFLGNLADCTKIGGYFIGTCFDGKVIFERMSRRQKGEPYAIFSQNGDKICEITKQYDNTGFPDDELSVGYAIHVYQETIQKVIREYLVNFEFLKRLLEDYGFVLATEEEVVKMDLPSSTGLFDELFRHMENEAHIHRSSKYKYGDAFKMSPEEKTLSFMNRYFIFKKVRPVDTKKVAKNIDYSLMIDEKRNNEEEEDVMKQDIYHRRKGYKLKGTKFII
jgi:hypothetical protein